jgi:8-oxo-dGTP pyrophosphatase MutT (NUDIX family)
MTSLRIKLEPVLRPIFFTWWRLRRSVTLGVRGIVCDEQGRVLLVRHSYTPGWHFPGGGVEKGEAASEALARELEEEAGVVAEAPLLIGFYANHINFPNDHIALYRIDRWSSVPPHETGEIAERGFFAPDALPDGTTPATRRRIAEVFEGAAPSATW